MNYATCNMVNCRRRTAATEPFCTKHRPKPPALPEDVEGDIFTAVAVLMNKSALAHGLLKDPTYTPPREHLQGILTSVDEALDALHQYVPYIVDTRPSRG